MIAVLLVALWFVAILLLTPTRELLRGRRMRAQIGSILTAEELDEAEQRNGYRYPPALTAHDREVWDLMMANHEFCTWIYRWSQERQATVKRCFCGAEEIAPKVSACPVRVTATVHDLPRALPAHPLALPAKRTLTPEESLLVDIAEGTV